MKPVFALALASSLFLSAGAYAADKPAAKAKPSIVLASVKVDGVVHTAKLKLDAKGKIIPWSATKWASLPRAKSGDSPFYWLGQHREESGIEYERNGKGRNGYGTVKVGTTADEVTVGVSVKAGKGFLKYRDLGSGNGDETLKLDVKPL